ncbi:MAG: chemotaxis response regulator protein-glutamate methylesterase [Pseudomonadota bacterium]
MSLTVLIVDDSNFFQRHLKIIVDSHPELNVIGFANNGQEAIEKVKSLKPDIVTMDYEMPMMDGVSAVRAIMADNPLPILMLSSMTYEGARITLDALDAGAMDFMTKDFSKISNNSPELTQKIHQALLTIGKKILDEKAKPANDKITAPVSSPVSVGNSQPDNSRRRMPQASRSVKSTPKLVAIGASTGGPIALTELLKTLPANFSLPIIIVQHMPSTFTQAFAERLNRQCNICIKQAEHGDYLQAGTALLAPGGKQLIIDGQNNQQIKIIDSSKPVNYKPCVDITFASLSNTYGANTLAIVLTGMGQDGRDGAELLKQQSAQVWTQSEKSCLIYGMPMAIDKANLSDASMDLQQMSQQLKAF